jgi:hypothetical protein
LSSAKFKTVLFGLAISLLCSRAAHSQSVLTAPAEVAPAMVAPVSVAPVEIASVEPAPLVGESHSQDMTASLEPVPFADLITPASAPTAAEMMAASFGGGQIRIAETPKSHPEQEIIVEGLVSYGNYKIFASGYDQKLYTAGIEYDRHSWGHFLKAQMDYVAEVLPYVMLDKPLHTDKYGNPYPLKEKNIRQQVYGVGISPIGFRWQWRSDTRFKPYLEAKGGMLGFTKKVPANQATYENFSLQSAMGVQVRMTDQWGLRLGLFSDFHFSNAFIVDSNPGLDVMNANLGISYHF